MEGNIFLCSLVWNWIAPLPRKDRKRGLGGGIGAPPGGTRYPSRDKDILPFHQGVYLFIPRVPSAPRALPDAANGYLIEFVLWEYYLLSKCLFFGVGHGVFFSRSLVPPPFPLRLIFVCIAFENKKNHRPEVAALPVPPPAFQLVFPPPHASPKSFPPLSQRSPTRPTVGCRGSGPSFGSRATPPPQCGKGGEKGDQPSAPSHQYTPIHTNTQRCGFARGEPAPYFMSWVPPSLSDSEALRSPSNIPHQPAMPFLDSGGLNSRGVGLVLKGGLFFRPKAGKI